MQFTPLPVDNYNRIIGLNSKFYQNIEYTDNPFTHIVLRIWSWVGNLDKPFTDSDLPVATIYKEVVNTGDTSILFELSNYIKGVPSNTFTYDVASTNQVMFFKWEYDVIDNPTNLDVVSPLTTISSDTYIGTDGWNWSYESNGYSPLNLSFNTNLTIPGNKYNAKINYLSYSYILNATTTQDCITSSTITPTLSNTVCPREGYLIAYINKNGLWDTFTPTGKVTIDSKIDKTDYLNTDSRPDLFDNTIHRSSYFNLESLVSYDINTGFVSERQGQYVEEIIYSPRVYLIEFQDTTGLSYTSYKQLPVVVKTSNFKRKTKVNDKSKISYTLTLEETINKIR